MMGGNDCRFIRLTVLLICITKNHNHREDDDIAVHGNKKMVSFRGKILSSIYQV